MIIVFHSDVSNFRLVTFANPLPTPFLLVGSQLGSLNTLAYARSHPQQVAQVVLIDPVTQSIFEENNKDSMAAVEKPVNSWRQFWMKKQIPFSRLLQVTAVLGLNRIAILLGFLEVPGVNLHDNRKDLYHELDGGESQTDLNENYEILSGMRLNHFMTDPSNLGAASAELGKLYILKTHFMIIEKLYLIYYHSITTSKIYN